VDTQEQIGYMAMTLESGCCLSHFTNLHHSYLGTRCNVCHIWWRSEVLL